MRRTKIVCTIGPASDSIEMIERLIDAGMNVARLNFAHGTHEYHGDTIRRIRSVSERKGIPVAILQDLAGPKIRVGKFEKDSIYLEVGQIFVLTNEAVLGNKNRAFVSYPKLTEEVKVNDRILLADGSIELCVVKTDAKNVTCKVQVGGKLSSNKGINLPGSSLSVQAFTDKDHEDLEFGLELGVDYVAMSFVRREEDILRIKEVLKKINMQVPIIAKIEKHEALEKIDEIINIVDGIMVARGDLAVETALERVPLVQKMLIKKSNQARKPVITATQMLMSMVESPRPTRAEANDVANAVLDGTDAVMLSEETTIGKYPAESVRIMARIIESTESNRVLKHQYYKPDEGKPQSIVSAVSHAASDIAQDLKAAAIITPTQSGSTACMVSSYRPGQPIIALSPKHQILRRLNLVWGIYPILSDRYYNTEEMIEQAKEKALKSGLVKTGDVVVITTGVPIGITGTTNLIKVEILK